MKKEKVIIIGGGPAGLGAAIYNARAFLEPLVIAGSPPGGQLMLTSEVENYPGFQSILGSDLIETMRKHAEHFKTRFINDNVTAVDFSKKGEFKITLSTGDELLSESVLIATGATAMWLEIESEQRLRGKGVSACATCDGFFFKDGVVAVVGGGDTAMEEALTLTRFASKVYIIHRRNEFRASKIMQKRVKEHKKISILWESKVEEVLGENKVEGVKIKTHNKETMEQLSNQTTLNVNGLFLAIGHKPNTSFLNKSGLNINKKGYLVTSSWYTWEKIRNPEFNMSDVGYDFKWQYATNIPGIFAAGDVVDYVYRQGASAVGMGVAAALEVERYLELGDE